MFTFGQTQRQVFKKEEGEKDALRTLSNTFLKQNETTCHEMPDVPSFPLDSTVTFVKFGLD